MPHISIQPHRLHPTMLHTPNQNSDILTQNRSDVVIPIAVKDLPKLSTCIKQISQNYLTPIHKIYVVTKQ
jgi:hypothetical protein